MDNEILFDLYRGDDHALKIVVEEESGVPFDISGWLFKATMTLNPYGEDDSDADVKVDVGPLNDLRAEQGTVVLTLPHEQTKELLPARYNFDIQAEYNGSVKTVVAGYVMVKVASTQRVG